MRHSLALVLLLAATGRTDAHSWLGCTDYRGDMNYYQDAYCVAYPRGWTQRSKNYFKLQGNKDGLTPDPDGKGREMARGFWDHEPCGRDNRRRASGGKIRQDNACQRHHIEDGNNFPAYTDKYPPAVYEEGGRYCVAWAMENHANAACNNNGGSDDMRLYYAPTSWSAPAAPAEDPTFDEFFKHNIRGPVCSGLGFQQDSARKKGATCQMTGELPGGSSRDFKCNGFTRSPRFCEDTDNAMGTGCFTLPEGLKAGKYTFMWYWDLVNRGDDSCTVKYMTCWEAEVVPKGSSKAIKDPTPGTKGEPNVQGLSPQSEPCVNGFQAVPEPAKTPPPTPPTPPPSPGSRRRPSSSGRRRGGGSDGPSCEPNCQNNGVCNPAEDHSLCGSRLSSSRYTCASTSTLTGCNPTAVKFKILCGDQKIQAYCPRSCGGCPGGAGPAPNGGSSGPPSQCRDVNPGKCAGYASNSRFYTDCNGASRYRFSEGTMTLKEYCGCTCERGNLIEMGKLPRMLTHTTLLKSEQMPVHTIMIRDDEDEPSEEQTEDSWEEVGGDQLSLLPELDTSAATAAAPAKDETVDVKEPVEWQALRELSVEGGPAARASWHCKQKGKGPPGRFPKVEVEGNTGKPDPKWDEVLEVAVKSESTGEWLRGFRRFSGSATNLRIVLNPGEKCVLSNFE